MNSAITQAAALCQMRKEIYRRDPVRFAREILKVTPDVWQAEVLQDLAAHSKVSVRSGQGVGKTAVESIALIWFLTMFPYARVVATAPTRQQLNDVLWAEAAKWISANPFVRRLLVWTKTRIAACGYEERWFAVARTATKPENMQGFHEENMLFIVDEASGVADPIMEAILGTLSGENNKLLLCGNPTRTSGVFFDSHHTDKTLYATHKVSSLDSARTNKENINALIRKFGRHSNVVRVRVDGEFPVDEDDVFITTALAEKGVNTAPLLDPVETIDIGVDVARFGSDNTVIACRVNNAVLPLWVRNGIDTVETANNVVAMARMLRDKHQFLGSVYVKIDDTGVGGGVTDGVNRAKRAEDLTWLIVEPVNFSWAISHAHYHDLNTLLWGNLKELLKDGQIALPNDNELIGELTSRKNGFSAKGKIKVESKDSMKKRGLPSPDRGDAVALAVYLPQTKKTQRRKGRRRP